MSLHGAEYFDMKEPPLAVSARFVSAGCSVFETVHATPCRRLDALSELVYVKSGQGDVWLDNHGYPVHSGLIVACAPGVSIRFRWQSASEPAMTYSVRFRGDSEDKGLLALFPQGVAPVFAAPGESGERLEALFYTAMQEYNNQGADFALVCGCLLDNILLMLIRLFAKDETRKKHSSGAELGAMARTYIERNYAERLSVQSIADALYVSPSHLAHVFTAVHRVSPIQYLNGVRVENAKMLLWTGNCTVQQVAQKVGFDNTPSFNRLFRQVTGLSPTQFRKARMPGRNGEHGMDRAD